MVAHLVGCMKVAILRSQEKMFIQFAKGRGVRKLCNLQLLGFEPLICLVEDDYFTPCQRSFLWK